jgi:hypothetical protein
MLYVPKVYFSFFGMLAYSVNAFLHSATNAIENLNDQRIDTLKITIITTHLHAIMQSKTK